MILEMKKALLVLPFFSVLYTVFTTPLPLDTSLRLHRTLITSFSFFYSMMNQNTTAMGLDLQKMTKAKLENIVNICIKKHVLLKEHYNAKDTLFGWTEDGQGVWILTKAEGHCERFEEIPRTRPDLGHDSHSHNEIMRLAGAEFFADWRDSYRARLVKEDQSGVVEEVEEDNTAQFHI